MKTLDAVEDDETVEAVDVDAAVGAPEPAVDADWPRVADALTRRFYAELRREVVAGESELDPPDLERLRRHYPTMMRPERYPPPLVTAVYVARRAPAVAAILAERAPQVFDAGCGFGSESFLFAAAGARVLAVDRSREQIRIARRRQRRYEVLFGRPLEIAFEAADLDRYEPPFRELSLTWMASVLANLRDQEAFLRRVAAATRSGGRLMVSDMNLLNPLFVWKEWWRRRRARRRSPEFAAEASFGRMFARRGRRGARYYPAIEGEPVDDAQFLWWRTLVPLLQRAGFTPRAPSYSGFVPPVPGLPGQATLERLLARVPLLRAGGYFYLVTGLKESA